MANDKDIKNKTGNKQMTNRSHGKKTYTSPEIRKYGKVEDITKGGLILGDDLSLLGS